MIQDFAPSRPQAALQRASGEGRIVVRHDGAATRLQRLYQDGCARIRLPRDPDARGLEAVLLNTSGGLTGGDRMAWRADAGEACDLTISTQACEKIYRSAGGRAEVRVELGAAAGARLDWLPQETILFDEAALARTLDVELAADASLLALEAVVLGRTAMKETVRQGLLHDRWRVRRGGRLVFADDLRLSGRIAETGALGPTLAGGRAFASILLVASEPERFLTPVRAAIGDLGGASAFEGKLFCRLVARDGLALRQALVPALTVLRDGAPLPRVWRL